MKQDKLKVGVIGATGMVGQRFLTLLEHHPYFEVTVLAASASSAGKTYAEAYAFCSYMCLSWCTAAGSPCGR